MILINIIIIFVIIIIFTYLNNILKIEYFSNNIKYLDGVDVIYWINMEKSVDRKNYMLDIFNKYKKFINNIKINRINAIDGSSIKISDHISKYNEKGTTKLSEFGCLLSHLKAINTFSNSDYNIALIFEDDVSFELTEYWKISLNNIIKNAPCDWGIIQLYTMNKPDNNILYKKWNDKNWSTIAYIINKKSAKEFMNKYYINNKYIFEHEPLYASDLYIYKYIKTYTYKDQLFVQRNNNDSTIHSDHIEYQNGERDKVLQQIKK